MRVLVTGGAGFIGSHFLDLVLDEETPGIEETVCLDLLTYAGNPQNIQHHREDRRFNFVKGDIGDQTLARRLLRDHAIDWVVNFAAETHVDRSIEGPDSFIRTNVVGTHELLKASLDYFTSLPDSKASNFRFLHISTDEVYGSLGPDDPPFVEQSPYAPNSPYSASKAASDHLVRAYRHTFGLPTLITNCSNNYGPRQFPEKLIPLTITHALQGKAIPLYGDGLNVRDWLYVEDHCRAILKVLEKGAIGETYNIGGNCEKTNIEIVQTICAVLDGIKPRPDGSSYAELITFVNDRPGHDRRYAMSIEKTARVTGWRPRIRFEEGIAQTATWYLDSSPLPAPSHAGNHPRRP